MARLRVCAARDLATGQIRRVCSGKNAVAVYNVNGRFYATDDTCTHGHASLAGEGTLTGDVVECGWHRGCFSVITGEALRFPAQAPLKTYAVVVDEGDVVIEIDDAEELP